MREKEADRPKGGTKGDSGRAERLAEQLRRNLQRRKQRARALAGTADRKRNAGGDPPDDSSA